MAALQAQIGPKEKAWFLIDTGAPELPVPGLNRRGIDVVSIQGEPIAALRRLVAAVSGAMGRLSRG